MPGDIYPWFFQFSYVERSLFCIFFSTLSLKYKPSKMSPECYVTKLSTWCFNIDLTVFCHTNYNLGQKVRAKLTKLSKIGFSMECFTADFLLFFTKNFQNLDFGWTTGYLPSNPSISGSFRKFPNFLIF